MPSHPRLLLAQAIGRFGNWFNQELYGLPTDVPWGLEIDYPNPAWPIGLPEGTLFHPTFLYEVLWNALGVLVIVWVGRRFRLQWGRLFAVYLIWYSAGRIVWESIRIDPSDIFLGLRTNVWAAHPGRRPRSRDLLRAEAPSPGSRAVALCVRPRVERRTGCTIAEHRRLRRRQRTPDVRGRRGQRHKHSCHQITPLSS